MRSSTFDQIDQQILDLLIENSRISLIDISEQVGLSRVAVKNRIDALEKSGVIEQYTVILNPEKVGRNVSVFFDIQVTPSALHQVADALIAEEAVTDVYLMTGASKLHVHAVAAGQEELEAFLDGVIHRLPGVTGLSCNIILSRIKDIKGLRL